jgi:hypothetical protein
MSVPTATAAARLAMTIRGAFRHCEARRAEAIQGPHDMIRILETLN